MVCLRTSVRNQLHVLAMGQGVYRKRKLWAAGGRTELDALALEPWASCRRQELLALLDRLDASLPELDRAVAKEAEQRLAARCLMEQPGVGPVTALMLVLTIGPVDRFQRSKQVVSYLGVNPRESSSGGRQRLGGISKQGNSMARFLLVEAAQTASRYDEELRRDYQRLKFRRDTAVAKVASPGSWRCGCIGSCAS
jgi:transposase